MNILVRWENISIALLFCISVNSFADDFHYNNLLIGDRASGMGGAYTAISDDASGMFYNPAGIVYVSDRNFSASVNAYSAQTKTYDNVIGGQPFVRKSSALLANYFGIVKPVGNLKIGFSYAVPDAVNEYLSQSVNNIPGTVNYDYTINLNNNDNTYNIGPSVAMAINNDLAVGLTLYVHQRETLLIQNQYLAFADGTNHWENSYFKLSETGLRPIIGVTWSPLEKLSLGMSLSKVILFDARSTYQNACVDTTSSGCNLNVTPAVSFVVPKISNDSVQRQYPLRVALGAAYFANSNLLLSGDFTYHTAVLDPVYGDKVSTLDVAVGTEYYLSKKWALRAGLFSNVANTPPIVAGSTIIEEHVNLYGGSLSFTRFTGDSSVTMGGNITYGKGDSQITSNKDEVQNATSFGWSMFLSSSY